MAIYIISHKPIKCFELKGYQLIQVGAYNKEHYCNVSDDIGDNISNKNPYYCELTGLYWIWKNLTDEYIGIVHYRRFFTESFFESHFLKETKIKKIFQKYDVILPIKTKLRNTTVRHQFLDNTGTEYDLDILESVLKDKYPDYLDTYKQIFNGNTSYYRNMFITSKKIYDTYCEWLFDILDEVEFRMDISRYNDYHKRIYGFLAERLLGVFMQHNHYKIYEAGVVQIDLKQNLIKKFIKRWQRLLYSICQ